MELKRYRLGELGEVCMCKRIMKTETSEKGDIPFYKIGTFGDTPDVFIDRSLYEEYKNKYSFPKKGDVLISAAGTIGRSVIYNGEDAYYQDSNIVWIDNDESKVLNSYLFYIYKEIKWKISTGSTILRLYNENIRETEIIVPNLDVQKKISDFLSLIDKKIALNTRMNAELEAMAKQLYDYWFVQFDFPDENGNPYKSSGGKMVYNSTLKRAIPAGWEVKTLNDLVETPKESITPFENPDKEYKHYSIPAFDTCGSYLLEKGRDIQSNKFVVHKGQILAPKLNPWYNRIIMVNNSDDAICSTEYVVLDAIEEYTKGFLFFVLKTDSFISYCTKGSSGTSHSQRRVPPEILKGFSIPFNKTIVSMYTDFVKYQIDKLNGNQEQTRNLTHLRDSLLPMLMNGQVTVE